MKRMPYYADNIVESDIELVFILPITNLYILKYFKD